MINKKLLEKFKAYRKNFKMKELISKDDKIFLGNEIVEDENKVMVCESETFVNIKYSSKNSMSRVLSNLFPYKFKFKGKKVCSIESVLQGIKYKNKKTQKLVFGYAGVDAYHTRASNSFDFWGNNGKLYFWGKEIDRKSNDYQDFLDELYLSCLKNPLYARALKSTKNRYLLHHIGRTDENETVLTRHEYESRLYALQQLILNEDVKIK